MSNSGLDVFQVIADSSRRQMLYLLSKDRMTINDLADNFDMSRPAVSKHVKILYAAGFISIEELGRERYCTLSQEGFNELSEWIDYFEQFWASKMKDLSTLLETDKTKGDVKRGLKMKRNMKKKR